MFLRSRGKSLTKVHPENVATKAEGTGKKNVKDDNVHSSSKTTTGTTPTISPKSSSSLSPSSSRSSAVGEQQQQETISHTNGSPVGQPKIYSLLEWDEIIEDMDTAIENTRTKSELYRLNGEPLKKKLGTSRTGLSDITQQIMSSYGLEFLGLVSEIVLAAEPLKIPLPEILNQLQYIEYKEASVSGDKLIVWVDDEPQESEDNDDRNLPFCQILITELLRLDIEPEIDVLVRLVQQVRKRLTTEQRLVYGAHPVEFAKSVILQLLRIGMAVSLASVKSRIIIIDADSFVHDEPHFQELVEMAEQLGHTVMYYRNTIHVKDKVKAADEFVERVKLWMIRFTTNHQPSSAENGFTEEMNELESKSRNNDQSDSIKAQIEEDILRSYVGNNHTTFISPPTQDLTGNKLPKAQQEFKFRNGKSESSKPTKNYKPPDASIEWDGVFKKPFSPSPKKVPAAGSQPESVFMYKLANKHFSNKVEEFDDSSESSEDY
ncbi:uncharacterized protein LOC110844055 isoform X2 [Folsomia candida]|uniref:uncharacterized protein LOC110844055 isoform X2 n=1 Tax=Folsomia candida TaxID=158441 RepID=UPI001604CC1A|nr:uncharacterized protein LOC110844055 isoform X2 [Folsomia candida]